MGNGDRGLIMTITIEVPQKSINDAVLSAELEAAAHEAVAGFSQGKAWPGLVRLHFADGTPQAVIDAALAAYAAHDPTQLSPDQQRAARAAAALESLGAADYKAWRTGVENATTQAQLKARLLNLGLVVWKLLQAQGLTDTADLEE